jgi:phage terminase Nu1 subunit (DNA packaging protein)
MNIKEYASHRNVSKNMVYRYLTDGTISKQCVTNEKPLELDQEKADACLSANLTTTGATGDNETLLFQKIRLTRINADRKELELARARGELIPTAEAKKLWGAVIINFTRKLETLPRKLPPLAFGRTAAEIEAITTKLIYEVRLELSDPDLAQVAIETILQQQERNEKQRTKKAKRK